MKKCTQCGQTLSDDTKFCFKCGGANFEPIAEAEGTYQQPAYQQPPQQQPPQQSYYAQQPAYQQAPAYQQQPAYQAQPVYNNDEPATIGNYLLFYLFMIIPVFNLVYLIITAVGGPTRKKSMTNFARAMLIVWAIAIVLCIILGLAGAFSAYRAHNFYNSYY